MVEVAHNVSGVAEGRESAFLKLNKVNQFTSYYAAKLHCISPAFGNTLLGVCTSSRFCKIVHIFRWQIPIELVVISFYRHIRADKPEKSSWIFRNSIEQ